MLQRYKKASECEQKQKEARFFLCFANLCVDWVQSMRHGFVVAAMKRFRIFPESEISVRLCHVT